MNYNEAIAYILEIPKFTKKNSLEHTKVFLNALGSPEKGRKVIHVAGTNGKGSVCVYLQSLLLAEKKTVGFFTSPHLVSMNERIRVNREQIDNRMFLEAFEFVYQTVQDMQKEGISHPTFFEFLFGMAMVVFEKTDVEYVVLETGLGGRLDATNVIEHPFLTIITSISLDHTEILGDTIEKIASEKAGIIKEGVPLIFDGHEKRSAEVIRKRAEDLHAPCREISKNAYEIRKITGKYIAFSSANAYYENRLWKIHGFAGYQVRNVMLVLEAMRQIAGEDGKHLELWSEVISQVCWEGRMEEVLPGVILDGAHNLGAVEAFAESVSQRNEKQRKTVILFSAVKEKDYARMIKYLCESVKTDIYIITTITNTRAVPAQELAEVFRAYTDSKIIVEENVEDAFRMAAEAKGEDGQVYCLGSLYLVGLIKEIIAGGNKNA